MSPGLTTEWSISLRFDRGSCVSAAVFVNEDVESVIVNMGLGRAEILEQIEVGMAVPPPAPQVHRR